MRRLVLLTLAVVAAGCGSTKSTTPTTTTAVSTVPSPASALPGSRVLYRGGDWGVVLDGTQAVAVQLVDGRWRADRSGRFKAVGRYIEPDGKATPWVTFARASLRNRPIESRIIVLSDGRRRGAYKRAFRPAFMENSQPQ